VKLLPVNWPLLRVHVGAATIFTGVLRTLVHAAASPVLNPLPVIVTPARTGPELGVNVSDGVLVTTINVAVAKSPVPPVTTTVVVAGATAPTLKLVECKLPDPSIVQVFGPIKLGSGLVIVHAPASFIENPEPVIVTPVP
jgi:hypothetical protein